MLRTYGVEPLSIWALFAAFTLLARRDRRLLYRLPLIKSIYGAFRDLLGFVAAPREKGLQQVVAVRIGETDMRLLGFVTRDDLQDLPKGLAEADMLLLEGITVGRVVKVQEKPPNGVVANVKVFKEFKDRIRIGSTFSVRVSEAGLPARPHIEIRLADPSSKLLPSGYFAQGSDGNEAPAK